MPEYSDELYFNKKMKTNAETGLSALKMLLPVLGGVEDWNEENIHSAIFAEIEKQGVKNGFMLWPLRVALSGKALTPAAESSLPQFSARTRPSGVQKLQLPSLAAENTPLYHCRKHKFEDFFCINVYFSHN